MTSKIYILQGDDLLAVDEALYQSEDVLQDQVAKFHDALIPGEQIDPENPRRWLLVKREAGIPNADGGGSWWSADHLFLDQDGVPTIVEVKRSSDTRIRREVVAQMLDYAANAVQFWSVDDVQRMFRDGRENPEEVLASFLGDAQLEDDFWGSVRMNLLARRLRLIFLADIISPELQRIVEFLNAQMDPVEVLAVQVKYFDGTVGGKGLQALVPQVIGANVIKPRAQEPKRKWSEAEFMETLQAKGGPAATGVAKQILTWASSKNLRIWWGEGREQGSFYISYKRGQERSDRYLMFAVWTYGKVQIQFGNMLNRPVVSEGGFRAELRSRLNALPNVSMPESAIAKYPSFPLSSLVSETALAQFFTIWDWYIGSIDAALGQA